MTTSDNIYMLKTIPFFVVQKLLKLCRPVWSNGCLLFYKPCENIRQVVFYWKITFYKYTYITSSVNSARHFFIWQSFYWVALALFSIQITTLFLPGYITWTVPRINMTLSILALFLTRNSINSLNWRIEIVYYDK